jgi:hypothetical protein
MAPSSISGPLNRRSNDVRESMTTGMAQNTIEWFCRGRESLPRFEDAAERTTTRYQLLPVAVVSALYLWAALLTGGDQHPPFFYLIHHGFLRLFAASLFVLTTVAYFAVLSQAATMQRLARDQSVLKNLSGWLPSAVDDSEPLIIGDSKAFYALSYYSPPTMKGRYVYLIDPQRSLKYVHHHTIERSLWALYPRFGLNVKAYMLKHTVNSQFGLGVDPKWTCLPSALIDDSKKLVLKARVCAGMLFSVSEASLEHYRCGLAGRRDVLTAASEAAGK